MDIATAEAIASKACKQHGLSLIGPAGSGAFKHTFRVHDGNGTTRALKVYQAAGQNARQQREIEAMQRCAHANVVGLDFVGTVAVGQEEYVVSLEEFLDGGSLEDRLKLSALSRESCLALGESLIGAIEHVSSRGLVHRDIKPANVMFRGDGTPVLVDLGLARDLTRDSLTKTWLQCGPGTPYYAAPEQLNNQKAMINWRTDQFALGVLLAVARFGVHPYDPGGVTSGDVIGRVADRRRPADSFAQAAKADGLPCLCRMVEPYPVKRYQTCKELIQDWKRQ